MTTTVAEQEQRLEDILDRLSSMAVENYYNPYRLFEWPDELPRDMWWMSKELTSTYDTDLAEELTEDQLKLLSYYESINFYSLNVHGIRELLIEVTRRIHTAGFEVPSEFFHHFIGEENEHMWFFAEFCLRYGKKIYSTPRGGDTAVPADDAQSLLVFCRILIFEELTDHYNTTMAQDESLHETIRQVNRIHHQDESRHIAMGRELVTLLYHRLKQTATEEVLRSIEVYLKRYMVYSLELFFNPQVYRDAGFDNPLEIRARLLAASSRDAFARRVLRKTLSFFERLGVLSDQNLELAEATV